MSGELGRTVSILVVEDDLAIAELLRAVLNDVSGWGATVVHDAAAAREVFRHVTLEVLVLDINLPGITGLELLELLRHDPHWNEPPVILLSANANQPAVHAAVQRGDAVRFIAKPFDVDELLQTIELAVADDPFGTDQPVVRQPQDRMSQGGAQGIQPRHDVPG